MAKRATASRPPKAPPFYDVTRDGVTFSLLTQWKECRERARLATRLGWTARATTLPLIFGSVFHEALAVIYTEVQAGTRFEPPDVDAIRPLLARLERQWQDENPLADASALQDLDLTLAICEAMLPQYFRYWEGDFDLSWHRLEREFMLPIHVPSPTDREAVDTFLRGKIDGIFSERKHDPPMLFETKTKSRFDPDVLGDLLPFELQVSIYLLALHRLYKLAPAGVRYNLVRRPQLRQKVTEPTEAFVQRIAADVADRPDWYFVRMDMAVELKDLVAAEREVMALVTDFVSWAQDQGAHYRNSSACEGKYGTCPMLRVCGRGDYTGLYQRKTVFRELGEVG